MSLRRIAYIDTARGVFLFWMIASHALGLANVPIEHAMQYIRPRGWATAGFMMLAGLTVAVVSSANDSRGKLFRRAGNLVCVAVVSNIIFVLCKLSVHGLLTADRALATIRLQEPWSISGILIPIAFALFCLALVVPMIRPGAAAAVFAGATGINLALNSMIKSVPTSIQDDALYQILFVGNEYLTFPIVSFAFLCFWTFGLGLFFRDKQLSAPALWVSAFAGSGIVWIAAHVSDGPVVSFFIMNAARFVISVACVMLFCRFEGARPVRSVLELLGRSSLLVFIMHRVFLQGQYLLLRDYIAGTGFALVLTVVTVVLAVWLCLAKEQNASLSRHLKRYGF